MDLLHAATLDTQRSTTTTKVSYHLLSSVILSLVIYCPHSELDETLPSKQAIRDAQQASRATLGMLAAAATSFMTDDGQVTLDDEGLFRVQVNGRAVVWIPVGTKKLQVRLIVCAHMKEAGHRGAVDILQKLSQ